MFLYRGPKIRCDNCSREFKIGEVIAVSSDENLAVCFYDPSACGTREARLNPSSQSVKIKTDKFEFSGSLRKFQPL